MKKISLFIAMSLDGYIADSKGPVKLIKNYGKKMEKVFGYVAVQTLSSS